MHPYQWWWEFGIINLAWLCYQDFKNKMIVDTRKNYFMFGCTTALGFFLSTKWWIPLLLLVLTFFIMYLMKKYVTSLGGADQETLCWMYPGIGLFSPVLMFCTAVIQVFLTLLQTFVTYKLFGTEKKDYPYYHVLLGTFIISFVFYLIHGAV